MAGLAASARSGGWSGGKSPGLSRAFGGEKGGGGGGGRSGGGGANVVRRLWTGTLPTLARDVPYSALYWFALEHLRGVVADGIRTEERRAGGQGGAGLTQRELLLVNFFSGAVAGSAVAAVTTPLDVVKTRVQIRDMPSDFAGGSGRVREGAGGGGANVNAAGPLGEGTISGGVRRRGIVGELMALAREGGFRSLYAGWVPRAARAGPTCGIVLVAYEMAKNM